MFNIDASEQCRKVIWMVICRACRDTELQVQ